MKKLIITAAIALTATLSIFTYQSKALTKPTATVQQNALNNSKENFGPTSANRLDISQAD